MRRKKEGTEYQQYIISFKKYGIINVPLNKPPKRKKRLQAMNAIRKSHYFN